MNGRDLVYGVHYLRGMAALAVVLAHSEGISGQAKYYGVHAFGLWFDWGALAVDVFFVISGFVIYLNQIDISSLSRRQGLVKYFVARFVRLIPFLWFCVLVHYLLRYAGRGIFDLGDMLSAAILYPLGDIRPLQLWTLRYEVLFYILFGFTFLFLRNRVAIFLIFIAFALVSMFDERRGGSSPVTLFEFVSYRGNLFFCAGVLIAIYLKEIKDFLRSVFSDFFHPVVLVALFVLVALTLRAFHYERQSLAAVVWVVMAASLILIVAINTQSKGYLTSALILLGDASYSIYLTHDIFLSSYFGVVRSDILGSGFRVNVLMDALIATLAGIGIHLLFEKRIISISRRLAKKVFG